MHISSAKDDSVLYCYEDALLFLIFFADSSCGASERIFPKAGIVRFDFGDRFCEFSPRAMLCLRECCEVLIFLPRGNKNGSKMRYLGKASRGIDAVTISVFA